MYVHSSFEVVVVNIVGAISPYGASCCVATLGDSQVEFTQLRSRREPAKLRPYGAMHIRSLLLLNILDLWVS